MASNIPSNAWPIKITNSTGSLICTITNLAPIFALDVNIAGSSGAITLPTAATATRTSVAGNNVDTPLSAANASRKGWSVFNDSTATLYLALGGAAASTSDYTVQVLTNGYYEIPPTIIYTGAIRGIWSAINGNARITELT